MTPARQLPACIASACLLALAGCGWGNSEAPEADTGKASLALALAAPMMVDGDLAARNRADAALAGGGPPVIVLPPVVQGPEAIEAAKQEAQDLAGGSIPPAPPGEGEPDPLLLGGVTAVQRAAAIAGPTASCAAKAGYALAWSLQLPEALPIYPRGNLLEAAGSDDAGCRLRVVRFVTPVEPQALVDFYHARAGKAGFSVRHRADSDTHQLTGSRGGGIFAVLVNKRGDGLTEAEIVANGF